MVAGYSVNRHQYSDGVGVYLTGGDFSIWQSLLDCVAIYLTLLVMPGLCDRAFLILISDNLVLP